MAITLQNLPRSTVYSVRAVSAANDLHPAFGGSVQRIARKGSRWAIDVSIPALAIKSCGMGLIADLVRGETELVRIKLPDGMVVRSYGNPLVNGVGQTGSTLTVDGLTPGVVIPKGRFLSITTSAQGFVYMVTEETVASGGGGASLPIWPMLRLSPPDNISVNLDEPVIQGFISPGQKWSISNTRAVGMDFTIEERE